MREAFRVDADLDATTVKVRRPPPLKHYQPLVLFGTLAGIGGGVALTRDLTVLGFAGLAVWLAFYALAVWAFQRTPPPFYEVRLTSSQVVVDGTTFGIGTLTMVLTDEKIVFRDADHQASLYHGIRSLQERMALRSVLEGAIDQARARHGAGGAEVPEHLRRAAGVSPAAPESDASSRR